MKKPTRRQIIGGVSLAVGMIPAVRVASLGLKGARIAAATPVGKAAVKRVASSKLGTRVAMEGQKAVKVVNGWATKKKGEVLNRARRGPNWR